jgi:hypothetical protein
MSPTSLQPPALLGNPGKNLVQGFPSLDWCGICDNMNIIFLANILLIVKLIT